MLSSASFIAVGEPYQDTVLVHDTVLVPVHDTTVVTTVITVRDTVFLHDTIYLQQYLYDTIYIHDTLYVGVNEVETVDAKIYVRNGQVVVEGADGHRVCLYDVNGRLLATKQDDLIPLRFDIPSSGTYLVKIGDTHARKVVVIR